MSTQHTQQLNNRQFLARWIVGQAFSWIIVIAVAVPLFAIGQFLNPALPHIFVWFFPLAVGIGVGCVTTHIQNNALQHRFGIHLNQWMHWNILAWTISAALTQYTSDLYPETFTHIIAAQALVLFTFPALVQSWMLRKHLSNTWLYLLASLAGAFTFALPLASINSILPAIIVGHAVYATVTGLALIWMFGITSNQAAHLTQG